MFTGIVDHFGTIALVEKTQAGLRLAIHCRFDDMVSGESISVDGACMTAIQPSKGIFECELSPETCALTIMGTYTVGTSVNLERPLRLSDRIGGHLVTGHIDQTATVSQVEKYADFTAVQILGLGPEQDSLITKKGSISVNGVSLTINKMIPGGFEVMLIPHTLERTNLGTLTPSSRVNLEFDWMGKIILGYLKNHPLLEQQP